MNKKLLLTSLLAITALVGCGKTSSSSTTSETQTPSVSVSNTTSVPTSEKPSVTTSDATSSATSSAITQTPSVSSTTSTTTVTSATTEGTVAHALAVAGALEDNGWSDTKYTVTGYVVGTVNYDSEYNSYGFDIADVANGTEKLTIYCAQLASGLNAPVEGSKVTINGYLKKYVKNNGAVVLEIAYGTGKGSPEITACDAAGGSTGGNTTTSVTSEASSSLSNPLGENQIGFNPSDNANGTITGAAVLGMDANLVTVTQVAGATSSYSNPAIVNKVKDTTNPEIRIYTGDVTPGSLTFTMVDGKLIDTIEVVCESTAKTCNGKDALGVIVKTGETVLTATENVYTVNAASVTLTADGVKGQVHITKLVITYKNA